MSRLPSARADRLLANLGYGSRREVQALIARGRAVLEGRKLRDPGERIVLGADLPQRLTIDGRPLDPPAPLSVVLHKPLGVVCSHREAGRSIYELLPPRWRSREPGLSTVGRLDAETSGLIIVTDDGPLLHRIISPKARIAKRYLATLARPLRGDEAALFASGELVLEAEETPLAPAVLEPLDERHAYLTITEGRYHQVRRMFAAVGNHVEALHRDRIGGLHLPPDMEPGAFHVASAEEIALILTGE